MAKERATAETANPYEKDSPQRKAWRRGYLDGMTSATHDPFRHGFREVSVSLAYTRGWKRARFV